MPNSNTVFACRQQNKVKSNIVAKTHVQKMTKLVDPYRYKEVDQSSDIEVSIHDLEDKFDLEYKSNLSQKRLSNKTIQLMKAQKSVSIKEEGLLMIKLMRKKSLEATLV